MNTAEKKARLQDLNDAIADLERQQIAIPDCEIIADALHAYTTKAADLEAAITRQA